MFDLGSFPGVLEHKTKLAHKVRGELFQTSSAVMKNLDRLEGHPNFYERKQIRLDGFGQRVWIYFYQGEIERFAGQEMLASWGGKTV